LVRWFARLRAPQKLGLFLHYHFSVHVHENEATGTGGGNTGTLNLNACKVCGGWLDAVVVLVALCGRAECVEPFWLQ